MGVSSKGPVGLHRTIQLQLFSISGWGIDLDYCDIEWFALETNRDHSVVFEITSKYYSSLIPKILMFTLALSCLTTSNLP